MSREAWSVVIAALALLALFGLALVMLACLALLRAGRSGFLSVFVPLLIIAAFTVILALRDFSDPYEIYSIAFITVFVVILSTFVSDKPWLPIMVTSVGSAGSIYMHLSDHLRRALAEGLDLGIDDLVICLLVGFVSAMISRAVLMRSAILVRAAESQAEANLARVHALQEALKASAESLDLGNRLVESSGRSSELLEEMLAELARAAAEMDALAEGTGILKASLSELLLSSKATSQSAEEQSSVVTQASAAIEEMTASIKNISSITESRREAIKRLDESTAQGRREMSASAEAVKQMQAQAASILDVVKVISAVASQTNLLAMNAAIEAAHAGEYGRGFSVVADEIRKLSEQTGKNVKAISSTIKETIAAIERVARGNEAATEGYGRIAQDAQLVSQAMEEIIRGLTEIASGTEEINSGVQASVRSTQDLKAATAKVDGELAEAGKALASLDQATKRLADVIGQLKTRSEGVGDEARKVRDIGQASHEGLKKLGSLLETS
jgi:methyl-accepting chemotaxis protein